MRSLALVAIAVLCVPLLTGSSHKQKEDDTALAWERTGGTYHTTHTLDRGTIVRMRILKHGKKAELMLVEWKGEKGKRGRYDDFRGFGGKGLEKGQVLEVQLPRPMKIGVRVGRKNARDPSGVLEQFGYHTLKFGEGWRLDVRVIDPTF